MSQSKVYSVSEVNRILKSQILNIQEFQKFKVKGEISGISEAGNGHTYFKLRDKVSVLNCAFFINHKRLYRGKKLENGMEVEIMGSMSFYEPTSQPSLTVVTVSEIGKGDILVQIELLKKKLHSAGIFNRDRKRPIPKYPTTIGIATAPNGAAIQDLIKVIRTGTRRVNILLAPCMVQGEAAPQSIINAIRELNKPEWNVDIIIAGRGGGSSEDLMAFNHENVVMAFYNSRVPIISAVGHEVDSVLTDLAADESAPTPSVAAEIAISYLFEVENTLLDLQERIRNTLRIKIRNERDKFKIISNSRALLEPESILYDRFQRVDEILKTFFLLGKKQISEKKSLLLKYENLFFLIKSNLEKNKNKYLLIQERLENFSPLLTLKRGYSVVRNTEKQVISSTKQLKIGENFEIILNEGKIQAEVKELK